VAGLADSALIAAPDARWQYSNIGFEILAHLVATLSGQPFESYVQERILTPLRMTKSTFLMTDIDSSLMAAGHTNDSARAHRPTGVYPYNRRHAGSSTLHSNVDDLLRFGLANLRHGVLEGATILSADTYQEIWKPGRDLTPMLVERARQASMEVPYSEIQMGLGWFLPSRNGRRLAFHSGGDTGFSSDLLLAPADSVAIVVMANTDRLALMNLSVRLLDAVVGGDGSR
jgi:CubicO group peptidase (beta-lactamase class C family)